MKAFILAAMSTLALSVPIITVPEPAEVVSFLQTGEQMNLSTSVLDSHKPPTGLTTSGSGLNVSSLIVNAGSNRESKLMFGDSQFAIILKGDSGDLEIRHKNQRSFAVTSKGDVEIFGTLHSKGAVRIDGGINYQGIDQWMLAVSEDFSAVRATHLSRCLRVLIESTVL